MCGAGNGYTVGERSVGATMASTEIRSRSELTESEYASLPPENRALLEWLSEYMSKPLTDEEKKYWRELGEFVAERPFTFRGESEDADASGH